MARFSCGIWDSASSTYLAGETVEIKDALGGTTLASTSDIGVGLLVTPNGDGTYYCDSIPAQNLWVYIDGAIQQELAGIPWDNGTSGTHIAATTAHGTTGDIMGQDEVDGSTIEYVGGLRVKDAGIVAAKLGASAVEAAKINAGAVTAAKIGALAVETAKINTAAVTGVKIAAAVAAEGLAKSGDNLKLDLSVVAGKDDFEFDTNDALALKKSLSSTNYISEGMTLNEMLSVIDNRMRQNAQQNSAEGKFYQVLYSLYNEDKTPSAGLTLTSFVNATAAYSDGLIFSVVKTPEMRQMVVYYSARVVGAVTAYLKAWAGSLSIESAPITNVAFENKALYLDISSLANWDSHTISLAFKVSGGSFEVRGTHLIVRSDVSALSGDTSYEADNPVE